jgi:virginiamycin B lyase
VHMMQNMDVPVPPDQWPTVTEYLIKAFPEKPKPAAVLIPGPVDASISEWPVPTPGSRPHDPFARQTAPSGTRGKLRTCWDGSMRRQENSKNTL